MPQPILTKYKQGDLGMPYPKKKDKMKNLNVQLAYKLGGFTDKGNLKVLTDEQFYYYQKYHFLQVDYLRNQNNLMVI